MARTLPQYKCIEGDLLEQIQAGVYKKGDHIPPEQTLSRQYGVSRVTVRKALENLVEQGILKRTPGAGTFVEKLPLTGKLPGLIGFSEEMKAQGLAPSTRVTEFRLEAADAATARRLRIADARRSSFSAVPSTPMARCLCWRPPICPPWIFRHFR